MSDKDTTDETFDDEVDEVLNDADELLNGDEPSTKQPQRAIGKTTQSTTNRPKRPTRRLTALARASPVVLSA